MTLDTVFYTVFSLKYSIDTYYLLVLVQSMDKSHRQNSPVSGPFGVLPPSFHLYLLLHIFIYNEYLDYTQSLSAI